LTAASWLQGRVVADRVLALLGGIVAVPVLVVVAAVVVVADRHPPLIGLPRLGQGGRPFTMWKVRTMRTDHAAGAFTVRADTRVTPLGRRLRAVRLDELPQLWNVVRGEMALLGPRPEAPEHVDAEDPAWRASLALRPGIAGPTQVVIHAWEAHVDDPATYVDDVLPHKLAVDAWYGAHASPGLDLAVVSSLVTSLRHPDRETAVHRRLARSLPATAAAIRAGTAAAMARP